jgi:hypothetical protein
LLSITILVLTGSRPLNAIDFVFCTDIKITKTKTRNKQDDVPRGKRHKGRKIRKKLTVPASKEGMDLISLPLLLAPKMIKTVKTVIGLSGSSPEMDRRFRFKH